MYDLCTFCALIGYWRYPLQATRPFGLIGCHCSIYFGDVGEFAECKMQSPFVLARDGQEWSKIELIAKVIISNTQRLANLSMPRFCPCHERRGAREILALCLPFSFFFYRIPLTLSFKVLHLNKFGFIVLLRLIPLHFFRKDVCPAG